MYNLDHMYQLHRNNSTLKPLSHLLQKLIKRKHLIINGELLVSVSLEVELNSKGSHVVHTMRNWVS